MLIIIKIENRYINCCQVVVSDVFEKMFCIDYPHAKTQFCR